MSLTTITPPMTAERPRPDERSAEERNRRDEKRQEIKREIRELREWQNQAYDLVIEADRLISQLQSKLPHWRNHRDEIEKHLQEAIHLLLRDPLSEKNYPGDTLDKLIDKRIEEDKRLYGR